jgi:O-antigen biosynthesis protein
VKSSIHRARKQLGRRTRQIRRLWAVEGSGGITDRVRRVAAQHLAPKDVPMPVRRSDVIAADLSKPVEPPLLDLKQGRRPTINWVICPAGAGAGGHTTIFRVIRYLESHGYFNRVYFYNVFGADHGYYEEIVRSYYDFHGPVASIDGGMLDAHAVVATAWQTAYPVFNARSAGKRFYFVQDFEPFFYPAGALSVLAENTYRMDFHAITIGRGFAEKLRAEFGMTVDSFEFGCDTSHYRRKPDCKRNGVAFYARTDASRRGFELGSMALEVFAARHPEIELHFFGAEIGKMPFRFHNHGRVTPEKLNHIYNRCYAGLSLSLTNVSLVPYEMLAAGCIPVVNDTPYSRADLKSPFVRYAPPSPGGLASELEAIIAAPDFETMSQSAANSVHNATWDEAGASVEAIFSRALKPNL